MTLIQKLTLGAAVFGALSIIIRKAWSYERSSRTEHIPTLQPVEDAEPNTAEPLTPDQLRVAQNAPAVGDTRRSSGPRPLQRQPGAAEA